MYKDTALAGFQFSGKSGNVRRFCFFLECRGILLHVRAFLWAMLIFGSPSGLFTDIRNVNDGISGEIVFTASVVLDAVGKRIIMSQGLATLPYKCLLK